MELKVLGEKGREDKGGQRRKKKESRAEAHGRSKTAIGGRTAEPKGR